MVTWQNGYYHIDHMDGHWLVSPGSGCRQERRHSPQNTKAFLFEKWRILEYPYSSTKGVWLFERCLVAGGQLHNICVCMCVRVQQQTGQHCGLVIHEF